LSTDLKGGSIITDLDKEYNKEVLEELRTIEVTVKYKT